MPRVIVYDKKGKAEEMESVDARECINRLGYTSTKPGAAAKTTVGVGARDPFGDDTGKGQPDDGSDQRTSPATGAYNPTSNARHPLHPVGQELPPGALLGDPVKEKGLHPNEDADESEDIENMTVAQMRELAQQRGLSVPADSRKEDLQKLLLKGK